MQSAECRFASELLMTWIKVIPLSEANETLLRALHNQRTLYPVEYAQPVHPVEGGETTGIVASHSLMSPDLPLSRRQHEMIATMVSVTNRCFY